MLRVLLLSLALVAGFIAPVSASDLEDVGAIVGSFYKAPDLDRVPDLLAHIAESEGFKDPLLQYPYVGFFAELYARHPDRISDWIAGPHNEEAQIVVAWALVLAGRVNLAQSFARRFGWSADLVAKIGEDEHRLATLSPDSLTEVYILWGASLATGDPSYVHRIIGKVAAAADDPEVGLEDVIALARTDERSIEKRDSVAAKYPQDSHGKLSGYVTALWSLNHIGGLHRFATDAIAERTAAEPGSDLAYLLRRIQFHSRAKTVVSLTGERFEARISHTTDGRIREKIKADFNNHHEVARNYRQFFRKGEPAHVAVTLMQHGAGRISFDVTVTSPAGSSHLHGPYTAEGTADGRIWIAAIPIDPAHLEDEGIYTVEARFRDGDGPERTVTNQFFVGGR